MCSLCVCVPDNMHSHVTLALAVYVITVFSFVLVLVHACLLAHPTYPIQPYHESCFYATLSTSTMKVDDGVGPCCRE